jgi:predicted kinase
MIGSGKSTTAERLAAKLIADGAEARAFNEALDDHPVRTRNVDRLLGREAPPSAYAAEQWNALADRCARAAGTTIVESTFLQNTVMPHFVDDEPLAVVEAVFADVAARLAPAAPLLVYLRPSDVAGAIRRVHAERGEPWSSRNYAFVSASAWARRRGLTGERAVVELYRQWERVVDRLLPTIESLVVVDPRRDWTTALTEIDDAVRVAVTQMT